MALCGEISRVEWSGVLFYDTEGVFGTDSFKCIAQEVFLMDIGTSGYTEYTYGPEVIEHMMKNKHLLKMKKGHIHSHNTMSVFFSGTDTDEILGNSAHHNIYLSLIVNNYNDMTAKIAFRAIQKSAVIEFKNDKGEVVSETVTSEAENIFIYDCAIQKPDINPTTDEKLASIKDFKIQELKAEKKWSSRGSSRNGWFREDDDHGKKAKKLSGSNVPKDLYSFIRTLLAQDAHTPRQSVIQVLSDLQDMADTVGPKKMNTYYDAIKDSAPNFYKDIFWKDFKMKNFKETVEKARDVLDNYRSQFPVLVKELRHSLGTLTKYAYDDGPDYTQGELYD